jgi:transcriptional regulator with XRE-family HTH domain
MADQFFPTRNEGGSLSLDGAAVYQARHAANLTQADVAWRMGQLGYMLTQSRVSAIERGSYPFGFTERMATAFASALGVGLTTLTGGRLLPKAELQRIHDLASQIDEVVEPGTAELRKQAG